MTNSEAKHYIESCGEYTHSYEREKLSQDWADKERVAKKIIIDFEKRVGKLNGRRLFDDGFGNGAFAAAFAEAGALVSGVEVNPVLLKIAEDCLKKKNLTANLKVFDGSRFPFADNSFDYVYSTSVLEHVTDASLHLREIDRVLKLGGKVYLSFPNRFAPKETHTGIWLLSYLPRSIARLILLRIFKRNSIDELNLHFVSYFALLRHLQGTGLKVQFEYEAQDGLRKLTKRILGLFGLHQSVLLKTIMVILIKKS